MRQRIWEKIKLDYAAGCTTPGMVRKLIEEVERLRAENKRFKGDLKRLRGGLSGKG